jgi:hypothetical protein
MKRGRKPTKTTKKLPIEQSKVKRGKIYCINNTKNKTPYWGGNKCESNIPHQNGIVRYVCPSCVATMMPAPVVKKSTVSSVDGEKKRRGRPAGSKNKVKKVVSVKR